MDTVYQAQRPYPPVCAAEKNPTYARAMLDNLGGRNSEISAVSLYFYNSLALAGREEAAQMFRRISIVEMHHMDIFGRLAQALGADPRLWTRMGSRMVYWTPGYHKYPTEYKSLLLYALTGEQKAIAKYRTQHKEIADPNLRENLERVIEDEEVHVALFRQLLAEA